MKKSLLLLFIIPLLFACSEKQPDVAPSSPTVMPPPATGDVTFYMSYTNGVRYELMVDGNDIGRLVYEDNPDCGDIRFIKLTLSTGDHSVTAKNYVSGLLDSIKVYSVQPGCHTYKVR